MVAIDIHALEGDPLLSEVWESLGRPRCHATGGYVRDRLLGRDSNDIDLVAPGSIDDAADGVRRLAARLEASAHVLGSGPRRVWRIEAAKLTVELWPLAGLTLEGDIRRRDFTCNAVVWPLPNGPLYDRVGALEDLRSGTLRGIARRNFEEDAVRLVRAARFVAQLRGFTLEPRTAAWVRGLAPRLEGAPRERIGQELLKLLSPRGARRGLQALLDLELLRACAPPSAECRPRWLRRHLDAADRLSGAAPHVLPPARRVAAEEASLALVLGAWGAPAEPEIDGYAWPRPLRRAAARAARMLEAARVTVEAEVEQRRLFIHRAGQDFPAVIALAAAVEPDRNWRRWWRLWRQRETELVDPEPLLDGVEIADLLGLPHGPELGAASSALLEAQARGAVRSRGGARRWLVKRWSAARRGAARAGRPPVT